MMEKLITKLKELSNEKLDECLKASRKNLLHCPAIVGTSEF